MDLSGDELAGIVDQFDALPRPALRRAVRETAFRAGEDLDAETIDAWIEAALAEFSLLNVEIDGEPYVVPGPRAFPTVPEAAADLTHVLDVDPPDVPERTLETAIRRTLATAAEDLEDPERAQDLLDVTYDAEAWIDADLADIRNRLDAMATAGEH